MDNNTEQNAGQTTEQSTAPANESNTPAPEQPKQEQPSESRTDAPKQEGTKTPEHNPSTKQEVGNHQKPQLAPKDSQPQQEEGSSEPEAASGEAADGKPSPDDLGWSGIKDQFASEVTLFTELGISEELLDSAFDSNGTLDVSKLGDISPRDAAVVKAAAENMFQKQAAKGKEIRKSYEDTVGGADKYAALTEWLSDIKKSEPEGEISKYLEETSDLLRQGGAAAKAVVADLYSRFKNAAGTSLNARIARADLPGDNTQRNDFTSRRDRLQDMLERHGGGTVKKGTPSARLKNLKGY